MDSALKDVMQFVLAEKANYDLNKKPPQILSNGFQFPPRAERH